MLKKTFNALRENTFKPILNYENKYGISPKGKVYSFYLKKCLIPNIGRDGYYKIELNKDSIRFKTSIHRLLGITYIPNPNNYLTIDHIDRNKTNNTLSNLVWANSKQQAYNRGDRNDNKLGHKHIHLRKDTLKYRVLINQKQENKIDKTFNNLEEAINYRNECYNKLINYII